MVVVIASPTRGFSLLQAAAPPVISPYPGPPQDQDEKGSRNHSISPDGDYRLVALADDGTG
jgi:hypothetical protein